MIKNYYGNNLQLDELAKTMREKLRLYKNYQEDAMQYWWNVDPPVPDEEMQDHEKHMKEIDEIITAIEKLIID